jgi:hypothetical protein
VEVAGSTPPLRHAAFRTAVALTVPAIALIVREPPTGPSVTDVVATPFEFVVVGVELILSDADGLVTKDQATD